MHILTAAFALLLVTSLPAAATLSGPGTTDHITADLSAVKTGKIAKKKTAKPKLTTKPATKSTAKTEYLRITPAK